MASILRVDTLTDASSNNSVPMATVSQGSAKQWVNLDGTSSGAAERDSFNTASTTDNGTGDYTATFTNAMGNTNYGNAGEVGTGGSSDSHGMLCGHSKTTGSVRVTSINPAASIVDRNIICLITHGDSA